jgi:MFS superfamily sulfate permease-like transporter
VVAQTGGRSQWAGLTAAGLVLLFALVGGSLVAHAPSAALAGVLLYVALRIVRLRTFAELLRRTPAEFALAVVTAVLIVALPIETGVGIGIFLSLLHGVFTATRARPIVFEQVPDTTVWWPVEHASPRPGAAGVLVMGFQAPLSFLNAYDFRRGVLDAIAAADGGLRLFVLEASSIVEIDFTAASVLSEVIDATHQAGVAFAVARLESVRAQTAFERFGLTARLGEGRLYRTVAEAIAALSPAGATGPQIARDAAQSAP